MNRPPLNPPLSYPTSDERYAGQPKRSHTTRNVLLLTLGGLAIWLTSCGGGIALGASAGAQPTEVEVPGPTVTKEVEVPGPTVTEEVEVTPQSCLDALASYGEAVDILSGYPQLLEDAAFAGAVAGVSTDDIDAVLAEQADMMAKIDAITPGLQADATDCRAGGL